MTMLYEHVLKLKQIKEQQSFTKSFVEGVVSFDELIIEIEQYLKNKSESEYRFDTLLTLCEATFEQTRKGDYNPIHEDLYLKVGFLTVVAGVDNIVIDALNALSGESSYVAYRLSFCEDDLTYSYITKMYHNYCEQFNSIYAIAKQFANLEDIVGERLKAEDLVKSLGELANQA